MNEKIWIAGDDKNIAEIIELYLTGENYEVDTFFNGVDALQAINKKLYDLCILDIMMPKMDGYKLTREIRKMFQMPIIIISAKNEDNDKILGLNIGADDYVTKPFNPIEVVARVNANFRRNRNVGKCDKVITVKDLSLDIESYQLFKRGQEIILTATEYKIIATMMKSPNRIFSRTQIAESILGKYYDSDEHTITVHISNLRDKLGTDENGMRYIKTVKGLGYKLETFK